MSCLFFLIRWTGKSFGFHKHNHIAHATTMLEKRFHNYYNKTDSKPQPKQKQNPSTQSPREVVHTKTPLYNQRSIPFRTNVPFDTESAEAQLKNKKLPNTRPCQCCKYNRCSGTIIQLNNNQVFFWKITTLSLSLTLHAYLDDNPNRLWTRFLFLEFSQKAL